MAGCPITKGRMLAPEAPPIQAKHTVFGNGGQGESPETSATCAEVSGSGSGRTAGASGLWDPPTVPRAARALPLGL